MKILKFFFGAVLLLTVNAAAAQKPVEMEPVKIVNSGARSVHLFENYFTADITKKILAQISKETLADIKINCEEENYPECIKEALAYNPADTSDKEKQTLDQLKMYRIAKYDNIRNGENFGEESIIVVPAAYNKNINGNCSFEKDFYIIIYTKDIALIK